MGRIDPPEPPNRATTNRANQPPPRARTTTTHNTHPPPSLQGRLMPLLQPLLVYLAAAIVTVTATLAVSEDSRAAVASWKTGFPAAEPTPGTSKGQTRRHQTTNITTARGARRGLPTVPREPSLRAKGPLWA